MKITGLDLRDANWDRLNSITPRLAAKDATLWGDKASAEAAIRLDWVDLPETSRELLPQLDALAAWSRERGHKFFILCGMGGSSLAPEVIAASAKKEIVILDSTDPEQIEEALALDLGQSCVIVASKSGSTIETSSQRALFEERLKTLGLEPADHMVIVTDPGSPLEESARLAGLKVVTANPKVGGRFSALSAFGLTPAALLGVDVSVLLDDAAAAASEFTQPDSSVVRMAAFLARPESAFATFFDRDSDIPGISDWIEQLIAESTGKDGKGVLPVVVDKKSDALIGFSEGNAITVDAPLGAQFIFWEWVTALLCYLLEVDPFNQPNVAESKERTGEILSKGQSEFMPPRLATANLEFRCQTECESILACIKNHFGGGYIAVMAYLDRIGDAPLSEIRELISTKSARPTTFGWGPRFLHSTGQFHKGGPLIGSFIQITGATTNHIEIPGADYDFARLIAAQAEGDRQALRSRELPVLQIHLKNRAAGIRELLDLVRSI